MQVDPTKDTCIHIMSLCATLTCLHYTAEHEYLGEHPQWKGYGHFGKCSKCECKSFHGYVVLKADK